MRFFKGRELRVVLGEPAFRALVRGGEVTVIDNVTGARVKMILQDIGFAVMEEAIIDAINKKDHYKPVTVSAEDGREV